MASDDEDVPESGAVFTFGKSRFLDNKFWIRNDVIIHVACGDEHSAVVTENGKLFTFGSNDWGQLGQGNTVQLPSPKLVKRLKPEKVKLVAAGRNHTIVSTESGKLYSFGCGGEGQLGHGDCENVTEPKAIGSLPDKQYKVLSCGSDFSAAVTAIGQLYTWGSSSEGQTGHGNEDHETPTQLHLNEKVVTVACGYYHMAVVTDDGSLYTCGENEGGKLGLEDSQLRNTSKLQKLYDINERVVTVACGGNHTAAVTETGKLYTFGQGDHGQLGLGSSHLQSSSPKQVTSLGNIHVVGAACGESHTAILTKHGNLYSCGDGRHGKLGMGEESFSNLFRLEKVSRFDDFVVQEVACGGCHTLVIAIRKTEIDEGTDSEAEAEKDALSASISSTKSLLDAVDGPQLYKGGLASTLPAGGAARNKRRQRNIENLGNSFGGSLPPVSKSSLPPLSGFGARTLPTLNKLPSKEEKLPVNPLNMSTLPKISHHDQDKNDKKKQPSDGNDNLSGGKGSEKVTKQETTPKDAESSSGISESEEEEDEENDGQIKKVKTEVSKKEELKQDTTHQEDVSEESMTQDESDSEEEVSAHVKGKLKSTAAITAKAVHEGDKTSQDHGNKPSAKEKEESSEEEEDSEEEEESAEEGTSVEKKEQLKVIGQKIKIKEGKETKEAESNDKVDDGESEDDEDDDDDDDDDDNNENVKNKKEKNRRTNSKAPGKENISEKGKTKKTKKGVKKDKVKKKDGKKGETDEESEEYEEEEEDDENESEAQTEDKKGKKSSKGNDKKSKDKESKEKGEENEDTVENKINDKKRVDAKDKKKAKKGKEKDDKEDERDKDVKNDEAEDEGHDENKNKSGKTTQDKIGKDASNKPEATKTKEKKSGICVLL